LYNDADHVFFQVLLVLLQRLLALREALGALLVFRLDAGYSLVLAFDGAIRFLQIGLCLLELLLELLDGNLGGIVGAR
jgi:hypothetical protein